MTLSKDLKVICKDLQTHYLYEVFFNEKLVVEATHDEVMRYAGIAIVGDKIFVELFDSHSDAMRRADIHDPNTFIKPIQHEENNT